MVLFDEIEKAHPDVFNTLLQLLDDGRLTDSQGRTVNFKNTIVIITSNIGSAYLNGDSYNPDGAMDALRTHFRPEFLNRIDDIIPFRALSREDLAQIVEIMAADLRHLLADRSITLSISPAAKTYLGDVGYDPAYGARPLKRTLQRLVVDPLAKAILEGKFGEGAHILVELRGTEIEFVRKDAVIGTPPIA